MTPTLRMFLSAVVAVLALASAAACVAVAYSVTLAERGLMRAVGPAAGPTSR